jgi:hypothetical protein
MVRSHSSGVLVTREFPALHIRVFTTELALTQVTALVTRNTVTMCSAGRATHFSVLWMLAVMATPVPF